MRSNRPFHSARRRKARWRRTVDMHHIAAGAVAGWTGHCLHRLTATVRHGVRPQRYFGGAQPMSEMDHYEVPVKYCVSLAQPRIPAHLAQEKARKRRTKHSLTPHCPCRYLSIRPFVPIYSYRQHHDAGRRQEIQVLVANKYKCSTRTDTVVRTRLALIRSTVDRETGCPDLTTGATRNKPPHGPLIGRCRALAGVVGRRHGSWLAHQLPWNHRHQLILAPVPPHLGGTVMHCLVLSWLFN